jgi:predicted phage baseplate assembly protein
VDGETVAEAKIRAPQQLRVQERAVTAADYEQLARAAGPSAARIRCLPAGNGSEPGAVRVLVVPDTVADEGDRLRFEQLIPPDTLLAAITDQLSQRKLIGTRLVVEPPRYQGVTVVARLVAAGGALPDRVQRDAVDALYRYLNPLRGGLAGTGWEFGRPVQFGEVFSVLQQVPGVGLVEEVRLFPADPITGRRGTIVERVELEPNALVFSQQHQVAVTSGDRP